jgi:IS4 transposase
LLLNAGPPILGRHQAHRAGDEEENQNHRAAQLDNVVVARRRTKLREPKSLAVAGTDRQEKELAHPSGVEPETF